jgi:RHS repeat-associated protein
VMLSDGPFSEYIYGHDLIGHIATSGGMTTAKYAHADVLGSVRLLTDGTGTEAGTALYDAFGVVRVQTGVQLPFGYTGQQQDGESGLVYLRARFYDPRTGRFLSKDPMRGSASIPTSQHAYTYARNNPGRWTDPTGREVCASPAGGASHGIFGGAGGGGTCIPGPTVGPLIPPIPIVPFGVGIGGTVAAVIIIKDHGLRHVPPSEREAVREAVGQAIEQHLAENPGWLGFWDGHIVVNGQEYQFNAFRLADGTISVGTIMEGRSTRNPATPPPTPSPPPTPEEEGTQTVQPDIL